MQSVWSDEVGASLDVLYWNCDVLLVYNSSDLFVKLAVYLWIEINRSCLEQLVRLFLDELLSDYVGILNLNDEML